MTITLVITTADACDQEDWVAFADAIAETIKATCGGESRAFAGRDSTGALRQSHTPAVTVQVTEVTP